MSKSYPEYRTRANEHYGVLPSLELRGDGYVSPISGRRKRMPRPLDEDLVLSWAKEHFETYGEWPLGTSGPIVGHEPDTWARIDNALRVGLRGLLTHSSLANLLEARLGVQNRLNKPRFAIDTILRWADQHYATRGEYPNEDSGAIDASPTDTWCAVDTALRDGCRGLPGGSSLPRLLQEERGRPNEHCLPILSEEDILAWADEHHKRTRGWPTSKMGIIPSVPNERWSGISSALTTGSSGLPGGSSLSQLLEQRRGVKPKCTAPTYDTDEIAAWMRSHAARRGRYPCANSGPLEDVSGETWAAVQNSLVIGFRGFPGGSSLAKLKRQLIAEGKLPADVGEIDKT